jgi:hypothetical protein
MMGGIVMGAAIGNLACPTGRYGECYTARELLSAWTGPLQTVRDFVDVGVL